MGYDRNDCWMTYGELERRCNELGVMNGIFPKDPFAEIERLRAALKPFADAAAGAWAHSNETLGWGSLTAGDLVRARDILNQQIAPDK